ncbi:hypothetical protein ACC741_38530, partial [Rhizobium johnstonii]
NTYLLRDFTEAFLRYFWRATAWGLVLSGALAVCLYAIATYGAGARDNLLLSAPLTIAHHHQNGEMAGEDRDEGGGDERDR